MKKAIVTGATGFIGSKFVELLLRQGIDVLALGRRDLEDVIPARVKMLEGAQYLKVNMDSVGLLQSRIETIKWEVSKDCVFFNLSWFGQVKLSDLSVEAQLRNVSYSVDALEIASKIGCSRFIQIGTMEEAFTHRYLELDHKSHTFYNRHVIYSVAKISAKNSLEVRSSQLGMDFIYVLHSHVMGPYDDKDSFLQVTLLKLINGGELIFSSGEQYFDVISIEDCALGYYLICKKGLPGKTYWVGSGAPQRLRNYVERMYRLFPSGKVMKFGELPYNDVVLSKNDFSIDTLVEDTGFAPTMSFEQTVENLYAHLSSFPL